MFIKLDSIGGITVATLQLYPSFSKKMATQQLEAVKYFIKDIPVTITIVSILGAVVHIIDHKT